MADETIEVDNLGPFTLNEVDLIERLSGVPLKKWFDGETFEGALRRAIVYVVACRDAPVTVDAAGEFAIKLPLAG